ncbi:RsmG family class I SAM-dependent methyltransferase [Bdellovibrionota bacterium FG-2]
MSNQSSHQEWISGLSGLLAENVGLFFGGFLSDQTRERLLKYYKMVLVENERQNLTRLIKPEDFFFGHILDAVGLLKSGLLEYPALDLGAGVGVPGIVCAMMDAQAWVLCDSEKRKAEFLHAVVTALGMENVSVVGDRVEHTIRSTNVGSIVARAVGNVEKILGWVRPCSTWNNLLLLKGPGWEEEWNTCSPQVRRWKFDVSGTYKYIVGPEEKRRVIIKLSRVPRGT